MADAGLRQLVLVAVTGVSGDLSSLVEEIVEG